MDIIKTSIKYILQFAKLYNISYEEDQIYYSMIKNIQLYCDENEIVLMERDKIENFLLFLEIPLLNQNIFDICHPDEEKNENVDYSEYTLNKLSDSQLLKYLMYILSTITFAQNDNLVCLKYNIIIWNTGFHKLARICRGKIIDMNTLEIISYPFDKFFNINEVSDTKEDIIKQRLDNNRYLYVLDKKDGSTIIVSKYKGKPIITTNGSFNNEQTEWAKELFTKKYTTFLRNMQEGYTYIFELIHPENKIIVDYGNEKALYLLSIRDLSTQKLLSIEEIHQVADKFNFPYPEVFSFNNLDHIIHLARTLRNANREGWVLRIGASDGNEYMVKIKLEEYFAMHAAFDKITVSFVYRHLMDEDLDDFISIANEIQKQTVNEKLSTIFEIRNKIKTTAIILANEYLAKHNLTLKNYSENRDKMILFVNDLLSSDSKFKSLALQYIKSPNNFDKKINRIKISHMKEYCKLLGYSYNS